MAEKLQVKMSPLKKEIVDKIKVFVYEKEVVTGENSYMRYITIKEDNEILCLTDFDQKEALAENSYYSIRKITKKMTFFNITKNSIILKCAPFDVQNGLNKLQQNDIGQDEIANFISKRVNVEILVHQVETSQLKTVITSEKMRIHIWDTSLVNEDILNKTVKFHEVFVKSESILYGTKHTHYEIKDDPAPDQVEHEGVITGLSERFIEIDEDLFECDMIEGIHVGEKVKLKMQNGKVCEIRVCDDDGNGGN